MIFSEINKLTDDVESAFAEFYDSMLNDERLGVFFNSPEQIKKLINTQKDFFLKSLVLEKKTLAENYIRLGEFHYDIRIPYIDFIKGTEILQEHFLLFAQQSSNSALLMSEIFAYFKIMKSYTAKGYLNRMIQEDKEDINVLLIEANESSKSHLPKPLIFKKIMWLERVLDCIDKDQEIDDELQENFFEQLITSSDLFTQDKQTHYKEIENRILLNTKNLFFFLKRGDYLEILPLYSSLLSIYKLTFILNNSLTIDYANKMIDDLQIDAMTQLFRKEVFSEVIKAEISYVKRRSTYKFSLVYMDIDDFKGVNDQYGHFSGDKVIENVGSSIRKNIRASDMGFRIGGDEFALILKDASKEQAVTVCQKILSDIRSQEYIFNEETSFSVSLSFGVIEHNIDLEKDESVLIKEVDEKLYQAKRKGKNCISG